MCITGVGELEEEDGRINCSGGRYAWYVQLDV